MFTRRSAKMSNRSRRVRLESNDALEAFAAAGLQISGRRSLTADERAAEFPGACEGATFEVHLSGQRYGCRVVSFASPRGAKRVYVRRGGGLLWRTLLFGNLVVRVPATVPAPEAALFAAVLSRRNVPAVPVVTGHFSPRCR